MQSLQGPAQIVVKSLAGSDADTNSSLAAPWKLVSLALLEYRQGHWAEAAQQCRSLPRADTDLARIATVHMILALCQQRLGNAGEALAELKQGRALVEAKFHAGLTAGGLAEGYWFDWVTARILLREAMGWIKSAPQAVSIPAHFPQADPPLCIPRVPSLFDGGAAAQTMMADVADRRGVPS